MEPKFQTSFIPKSPITPGSMPQVPFPKAIHSFNILPVLATIIFVLAVLAWGGLFGYKHVLTNQINDLNNSLSLAQSSFDPDTLHQVVTASDQIQSARGLLSKHIAVSNVFALLEGSTLPNVSFNKFDFGNDTDGTITVSVDGLATSYAVLAEQSALFNGISYLKKQSFSGLDVSDTGSITMKFTASIDPTLIAYKKSVQTINPAATATPVQNALTATSTATTTVSTATSTSH